MQRRHFLALPLAAPLAAAEAESGFTSLFDGKTLRGWRIKDGPETAFYVDDGAIVVHPSANFPTWLSTAQRYENFDFRGEFFLKGWIDSGIYLHAPDHGRNSYTGFEVNLFHQQEKVPTTNSNGSIFPLIAPKLVNVRSKGEWNSFRILFDWPSLQVWMNDEQVQDLNVEENPELRYRLRKGFIGLESLSYPIRFRNLRIKELPAKETWESLYESATDFEKWHISEGKPLFQPIGGILRGEGLGHLATKASYKDFEFHSYIRTSRFHNGGVLFHTSGEGLRNRHYEIQIHNVENAHYPTGSLYGFKRSIYPKIADEQWYLLQLVVKDRYCMVRINGETVMEYDKLENLEAGPIELQAHQQGSWADYKHIRIKRL